MSDKKQSDVKQPGWLCKVWLWVKRWWLPIAILLITSTGLACALSIPQQVFETPREPANDKSAPVLLAQSNLRLAFLYITGGAIAVVGLIETFRKNNNEKLKNDQDKEKNDREHLRQVRADRRERYTKAVEQLGDEKTPIRMGGVYTLVGLVDEWLEDESIEKYEDRLKEGQVIINNLCAYIRSPFTLTSYYDELSEDAPSLEGIYKDKKEEFYVDKAILDSETDVRLSIIKEIHDRIQDPDKNTPGAWSDFEYDFSGSTFFYPIHLTKSYYKKPVNFSGATYQGWADFSGSTYEKGVIFSAPDSPSTYQGLADFSGSTYQGLADFSGSTYQGLAAFMGSTYKSEAAFMGSTYEKGVLFSAPDSPSTYQGLADFSGSTYQGLADFSGSTYQGLAAFMGSTYKSEAAFMGSTYEKGVLFSAPDSPSTYQGLADFSGSTYEGKAEFSSSTYQDKARFSGSIYREGANFSGSIYQSEATFMSSTYQSGADFGNSIYLEEADLSRSTYRGEADFSGSIFYQETYFGEDRYSNSSSCFTNHAPQFYDETNRKNTLFGSPNNDFTVENGRGYPIYRNLEGLPLGCKFLTSEQKEYLADKFREIEKINNKLREVKDPEENTKLLDTLESFEKELYEWQEEATTVKVAGTAPEEEDN